MKTYDAEKVEALIDAGQSLHSMLGGAYETGHMGTRVPPELRAWDSALSAVRASEREVSIEMDANAPSVHSNGHNGEAAAPLEALKVQSLVLCGAVVECEDCGTKFSFLVEMPGKPPYITRGVACPKCPATYSVEALPVTVEPLTQPDKV